SLVGVRHEALSTGVVVWHCRLVRGGVADVCGYWSSTSVTSSSGGGSCWTSALSTSVVDVQ
ncbi:unnamed protein product, partial [Ilex paraguariensis]